MKPYLKQFKDIADYKTLNEIERLGNELFDLRVLNVNSTVSGGGVAELLMGLIPLFNGIGIHAKWNVIKTDEAFLKISKQFYNALQGQSFKLTSSIKSAYKKCFLIDGHEDYLGDDIVIIHDHQPISLINCYMKKQPWIWRCHSDIYTPNKVAWNFLKPFIKEYDMMVISMEKYRKRDVKVPQIIIPPSLDPANEKNMPLTEKQINKMLSRYNIDRNKPIITQISRFDKWKDPIGVIKSYKKVKEKIDCKLVLLGECAPDDPEGPTVHSDVIKAAKGDKDIIVISKRSDFLVNALQRSSTVIIQKSLREGFAITVAEALWKETPVVGGNHGGIPLQIKNGKTGYLVDTVDETAKKIIKLLKDAKLRKKMGKAGKEHIRKNFLITRHALDYLKLFKQIMKKKHFKT